MEISEERQHQIFDYWNKYTNNVQLANALFNCEISGFGRSYLKKQLEQGHLQQCIQEYFNNFLNYEKEGKGLFIFGKNNTGKTIAITILAKNIVMMKNPLLLNNFSCKFFLYDDLTRLSLDGKSFSILEPIIKQTDILVLDNIGNETGLKTAGKSSVSLLDNILRNREMNEKITWLTSNIDLNEIGNIYTEVIASIIKRNCKLVNSSIY